MSPNHLSDQLRRLTQEERDILDACSGHKDSCKCNNCLRYWTLIGVNSNDYGPFSEQEIIAYKLSENKES